MITPEGSGNVQQHRALLVGGFTGKRESFLARSVESEGGNSDFWAVQFDTLRENMTCVNVSILLPC